MPDADVIFARQPFLVLRTKSDHRTTLRADEIVRRDTDRPAEPRGHADDLVGGVNRVGAADFRNCLHLLNAREQLHAGDGGLQPK
jgi:hypothetical protein